MTEKEVRAIVRELNTVYPNLADVPAWGKPTIQKLMKMGAINGTGDGIDIPYETLRLLVINDRAGLYGK